MKRTQLIASLGALLLAFAANQTAHQMGLAQSFLGGLPWYGWVGVPLVFGLGIAGWGVRDTILTRRSLAEAARRRSIATPRRTLAPDELKELGMRNFHGPEYPHPVIFPQRCIGCHACVEACPHDVLAMVDGVAGVVAAEQCMEDTSCQVVCPVSPKACIVVNTTKTIKARPAPMRDGSSYETNVPGCYVIGDVSGVPLIKNAVKEGAEAIAQIATAIINAPAEPQADYDVAIIGAGPGGASAAAVAQERGLRYVAVEQDKLLATIAAYPLGKYVFFKPEYREWFGGLGLLGLGWDVPEETEAAKFKQRLSPPMQTLWAEQLHILSTAINAQMPAEMKDFGKSELQEKLDDCLQQQFMAELFARLTELERASLDQAELPRLFDERLLSLEQAERVAAYASIRTKILQQLNRRAAGELRERILVYWAASLRDRGVQINEGESARSIKRATDGDYFVVNTERLASSQPQTYRARRVLLAIGLRGTPTKLGVPGEDLRMTVDGREQEKVRYRLADPDEFRRRRIVVVGGGNSAVEAAIDLVADRDGHELSFRDPERMNEVTLLVRSDFKTDLKFGNKLLAYKCMDAGRLKIMFRSAVKEIRPGEVVVMDSRSRKETAVLPNDFVFALVGGERPDKFLESVGIKIDR
jgi:thioredoxin reductase